VSGPYGERGVIGAIDLSTCTSMIPEFVMAAPAGVNVLFSRLRLPDGLVNVPSLRAMVESERFEEAAVELADGGAGAIVFGCTSASLLLGPGFDRSLSDRITSATGVPASTTASAVVEALGAIGARRIAVGTPYDEEITERERVFVEASGFEVVSIRGLGIGPDREIGALGFDDVRALARSVMAEPVDALFLSCTNLAAFPLLAELEAEYGVPVVTSNAATLWKALQLIGVDAARPGFGMLLSGAAVRSG
jgi:maleate cis-trans isomerase